MDQTSATGAAAATSAAPTASSAVPAAPVAPAPSTCSCPARNRKGVLFAVPVKTGSNAPVFTTPPLEIVKSERVRGEVAKSVEDAPGRSAMWIVRTLASADAPSLQI
ncbi:hypothetical protein B0T13DRAFT_510512 [Neurospora crassa]|nr:hypothetical protein B0T13DRAFT_510512 [Neurospora crassa]